MELAECADHRLWALADDTRATRMEPGRSVGGNLHLFRRKADRVENRQCVGLDVEDGRRRRRARPMTAGAGERGGTAAHARRRGELVLRPVAAINLADLEEREIEETAIGIASDRGNQARKKTGAHI